MIPLWSQSGGANAPISFALPLGDLGAGAVDTAPLSSGGSATATFTRATTAWTKLSTGLWASVASGTARSYYLGMDTTVGAYGGYLPEGQRTNEVLWSRDLTNIAWTATTATVAKDQTGIDGAANAASSILATAGNATVLQIITEAATTRTFSAFVKRLVGTGEIDMTEDGGLTWTNVTALINGTTYTQVSTAGQSVLNPSVGFRVVTNGDKIAVDMTGNEAAAFASSPIPTTTVAVQRNADLLNYPSAGNINATSGAVIAEITYSTPSAGVVAPVLATVADTAEYLEFFTDKSMRAFDGTAVRNLGFTVSNTPIQKVGITYSGTSIQGFVNGVAGTAATFDGAFEISTTLSIGYYGTGVTNNLFGAIRNLRIYSAALSPSAMSAMTTP